jgi:hypothetical protein
MQPFGKIPVYQDDEVTLFGMCTNTIAKVLSCNFRVAELSHQFFAHGLFIVPLQGNHLLHAHLL